jgi:aminopeptidase N
MPLVPDSVADPEEALNPNPYQKGGWLLHMLRRQVGDEAFWSGIQTYYREFRDGNASTDDLRRVMEEVSGQDLTGFFQQWARRPGHPMLEGEWRYDPDARRVSITIRQVQRGAEPFRFPLDLGVAAADGSIHRVETLQVSQREQTFQFSWEDAPHEIVLDPDTWLLFQGELVKGGEEESS